MRVYIAVALMVMLLWTPGCAHKPTDANYWKRHSVLPKGESVAILDARANDQSKSQAERARAVFTLLARHIKVGASANKVHRIFVNTAWLQECRYDCIRILNGWMPIVWPEGTTAYELALFPLQKDSEWGQWHIYFSLSGDLKDEDGLSFLRGEQLPGNPKLYEFALCFPDGRIERYSSWCMRGDDFK